MSEYRAIRIRRFSHLFRSLPSLHSTSPLLPFSLTFPPPLSPALPAGFRDSYSFRLGGETTILPAVALRMGLFWERSALTPQNVSASLVDTNKVYVGTGAGFSALKDSMTIDIGAGWMFYENLEIRDSEVTNINVVNEDQSYVIGNGDLSSHGWVLSAQVAYRFGSPSK